jgi:hypothetical protein
MFMDRFFRKEKVLTQVPAGLITDITDIDEFKERFGVKCKAKILVELIKYLDTLPEQSWNVNKIFRSNSGKIRTVGIYDNFPTYEDAAQLFEKYGGGKYTVLCISPRRTKIGYYEFEGEDKEPEEEEPARTKRFRLKYKPKDFKEAVLLQRLEEGDEQVIQKITDAELSRQGIASSESDACAIQPQGISLKEHFDTVEELKDEIHKRDMQIIEERFKKGEKSSGWDAFVRMIESDAGKELGREALDTIKEIFKTAGSSRKEEVEVENFEDYKDKSLTPAKEQAKKEKPRRDFTPLKIMHKFIENDGDPSAYLENMSIAYPEHPFCQTLIACETLEQFMDKLKPLEQKLPILFGDKGKAWLEELFTVINEFKKGAVEHEPGTETESKVNGEETSKPDAGTLSGH